ncbi:MAG: peptide-methionine (R)-S-oxide reductase MsrB [Alphaproteobacteria bacterium]|nr:peptide-methionine (R)-S-oxide reductase MsrB [Alphaproteobacteria bacterium]
MMDEKIKKTEEEWKKILNPEEFLICRKKGTEKPFSGQYCKNDSNGIYLCKCCNQKLFETKKQFESGSGWPSFFDSKYHNNLKAKTDDSHGMKRTEVLCRNCGAHLGHVFEDGPQPTGLRYCINSISLIFKEDE